MNLKTNLETKLYKWKDFLRNLSNLKTKLLPYALALTITACGPPTTTTPTPIDPVDPTPTTNEAPVVSNIENQTINKGESFQQINLDNYVSDPDNTKQEISWTYQGNTNLSISINNRTATITKPYADYTGLETITFTATDPEGLTSQDSATLKINAPPQLNTIPDQTIDKGQNFQTINLNNYLSDPDNTNSEINITHSGNTDLTIQIDQNTKIATITKPQDYTGQETITFNAEDPYNLQDSKSVILKINAPPVVYDIPDQTINEGSSFNPITLDDYVSDPDNLDSEQTWNYSGNTDLTIDINQTTRIATITPPSSAWTGNETITFQAKDPRNLSSQDPATFIVNPVIPQNNNPTITSTPPATGTEGVEYRYLVESNDIDGDPQTCSLPTKPSFLSVVASSDPQYTCEVVGTPQDADSNLNHNVVLRVEDGKGGFAEQAFNPYFFNTEQVSGIVEGILSSTVIGNAEVKVGNTSVYTDSNGNYILTGILDGDYLIQINEANYFTHNAGILRVNKTKNLEGKLTDIDFKIIPLTFNMDFFNETGRCNRRTQRIPDSMLSTFQSYIDINPVTGSGATITQEMIDLALDRIELEWPVLTDGKLTLTKANGRIQTDTNPPVYPTTGYNILYWNSTIAGQGGHAEAVSSNEIISTKVAMSPYASIGGYRQELAQTLGIRCDSNSVPSIFNDPMTQTDYLQIDYDIIKVLYNRPTGNRTPDDNPTGYIINP